MYICHVQLHRVIIGCTLDSQPASSPPPPPPPSPLSSTPPGESLSADLWSRRSAVLTLYHARAESHLPGEDVPIHASAVEELPVLRKGGSEKVALWLSVVGPRSPEPQEPAPGRSGHLELRARLCAPYHCYCYPLPPGGGSSQRARGLHRAPERPPTLCPKKRRKEASAEPAPPPRSLEMPWTSQASEWLWPG